MAQMNQIEPTPPPVVYQPGQQHHTTVVISQPTVTQPKISTWTSSICGCFDDIGVCMCVMCCPTCAATQLVNDLGENYCLPCCVPNWLTAVRTRVRTLLDIQGSICDDCMMATYCGPCTLCQLMHEVKLAKQAGKL